MQVADGVAAIGRSARHVISVRAWPSAPLGGGAPALGAAPRRLGQRSAACLGRARGLLGRDARALPRPRFAAAAMMRSARASRRRRPAPPPAPRAWPPATSAAERQPSLNSVVGQLRPPTPLDRRQRAPRARCLHLAHLRLRVDVDAPAGELRREAHVLALLADGQRQLVVGDDQLHACGSRRR